MQKFTLERMTVKVTDQRSFESALDETKKIMDAMELTLPVWINHKDEVRNMVDTIEAHLKQVCKKPHSLALEMATDRFVDILYSIVDEKY